MNCPDHDSIIRNTTTVSDSEVASVKILQLLQEESVVHYSAFGGAFGLLRPVKRCDLPTALGTDGSSLFFQPDLLCFDFVHDTDQLRLSYLHLHLHCLCLHPLQQSVSEHLWDLACDLSATFFALLLTPGLIDQKLTDDLFSWFQKENQDYILHPDGWTEAREFLPLLKNSQTLQGLAARCFCDSHMFWEGRSAKDKHRTLERCSGDHEANRSASVSPHSLRDSVKRHWTGLKNEMKKSVSSGTHRRGISGGAKAETVSMEERDSIDYHQFLRRFTVPGEEAILDPDTFDYIPYCYGLTRYGNMPFLEPLEYREVNRLDELAIAIDTSGSCSGPLVRRFLEEKWTILRQRENFFSRMRLHLIQCDSIIQDYRIYTSVEEWESSIREFKVFGQGNTDFRPVFDLLQDKIAKKEIRRLRGLLYFTDGDGIFPGAPPPFDTAFVFLNKNTEKHKIPGWGIRLNLNLPDNF